jgi:predicted DNA-binding transcriptional regulator AlpA
MGVTIKEAAEEMGVSRSILYKWIEKGLLHRDEATRMVKIGDVAELVGTRRSAKGRAAGWAHKERARSKVLDLGMMLERSVVLLSGVMRALSPAQRSWVKDAILAKIDDPKLVQKTEVPIPVSLMAIEETQQEQVWNNVLVRGTLSPEVLTSAPDVRAWGPPIKRLGSYEKEGLDLPDDLRADLNSMAAPSKRRVAKTRVSQSPVRPNGK